MSHRSSFFPAGLFLSLFLANAVIADGDVVVIQRKGTFHQPNSGKESLRIKVEMQKDDRFSRLSVELDVTHDGWKAMGKKQNHAIFWINRGQKWRSNVFGYVNVFGPTAPKIKMANNVQQKPGTMLAKTKPWTMQPGKTYHFKYIFDTSNNRIELTISANGKQLVRLSDKATGETITATSFKNSSKPGFFIVFGHPPNSVGPEVPTYGWKYANLRVEFFRDK